MSRLNQVSFVGISSKKLTKTVLSILQRENVVCHVAKVGRTKNNLGRYLHDAIGGAQPMHCALKLSPFVQTHSPSKRMVQNEAGSPSMLIVIEMMDKSQIKGEVMNRPYILPVDVCLNGIYTYRSFFRATLVHTYHLSSRNQ